MEEIKYYLITSSEDGISVRETTGEKLTQEIAEGRNFEFVDEIPAIDKGCFWRAYKDTAVLIRGEIIQPTPKHIVTEYVLD